MDERQVHNNRGKSRPPPTRCLRLLRAPLGPPSRPTMPPLAPSSVPDFLGASEAPTKESEKPGRGDEFRSPTRLKACLFFYVNVTLKKIEGLARVRNGLTDARMFSRVLFELSIRSAGQRAMWGMCEIQTWLSAGVQPQALTVPSPSADISAFRKETI